jgi:small subunit ribosomal protein S20
MPNSKSAAKRHRQSIKRRDRNRAIKSEVKTHIRKVRELIAGGDGAAAETQFRLATKNVDQAAAAGVVHRNLAARVKSRLSSALKSTKSGGSTPAKATKAPKAPKAAKAAKK